MGGSNSIGNGLADLIESAELRVHDLVDNLSNQEQADTATLMRTQQSMQRFSNTVEAASAIIQAAEQANGSVARKISR